MRLASLLAVTAVVTACGGGGDGGGGGTPPPATVASVAITPNTAQSTSLCGNVGFSAQARDAQGNALTRSISWNSSQPTIVSIPTSGSSVTATGIGVGSSNVTASADGTSSTAVAVTVGALAQPPSTSEVQATASSTFTPACVVIGAGGTVTWQFGALAHNVVFGTNKPPGGDIGGSAGIANTSESRTFPTAGDFPYTCTLHSGMNGRVIVQ